MKGWLDNMGKAQGGVSFRDVNDNMAVQAAKMFDPTGISSYPDVYYAIQDANKKKHWEASDYGNLALNVVGALPMIGKASTAFRLGKIAKETKAFSKARKVMGATEKVAEKINKVTNAPIQKLSNLSTSSNVAKKVIGKGAKGVEKTAKWLAKPLTPASQAITKKTISKADVKNLGVNLLDLANVSSDIKSTAKAPITREARVTEPETIYYNTNPKHGEVEKPGQIAGNRYVPISNSAELSKWKAQKQMEDGGKFDGLTNKGFNYNGAWGGPAQSGKVVPATRQDSLNVYNNAMKVNAYFNKHKYKGKNTKAPKNVFNTLDSFADTFSRGARYASVPVKKGFFTGDDETELKSIPQEQYRKDIDKNRFYQRELANTILDTRSPMQLFDKRIYPHIERNISTDEGSLAGDAVNLYIYDPLAVKPYDLLTPAEIIKRRKLYGDTGMPKPTTAKTTTKKTTPPPDKKADVPVQQKRTKIEPIERNVTPSGIQSDFELEATTPVERPQARIPKYYSVEDINPQPFGGGTSQYEVHPDLGQSFRQLDEGHKRTVTPHYENGGWLDSFQDGGNIEDYNMKRALELGYTADETGHWPSVDEETGEWLKSKTHPTRGMEMMAYELNPELRKQYDLIENEKGIPQYVDKKQFQDGGEISNEEPIELKNVNVYPTPKVDTEKINWYDTLNYKKWGLEDYSKAKNFNTAFRAARNKGEEEFVYKDERYNTNLIDKAESDEYLKSKEFLRDYYKTEPFKPADIDTANVYDRYAKEKYGETWSEYYDKNKKEYDKLADAPYSEATQEKFDKIQAKLDMLDHFSNENKKNPEFLKYLKNVPLGEQELKNLDEPYYFSITSQKPEDMKAEGYVNSRKKKMFLTTAIDPSMKEVNTTYGHELSHKGDSYDVGKRVPRIDVDKVNKKGGYKNIDNEFYNYLSDPTEVEARKMSTLYYLNKKGQPYRTGQITEKSLQGLYKSKDKLPFDIEQLLEMYKYQKGDLLKYLNNDFSYNKKEHGGSVPGAVGFSYARTGAPSNGKYAKKTLPSAQDGIREPRVFNVDTPNSRYEPLIESIFLGKDEELPHEKYHHTQKMEGRLRVPEFDPLGEMRKVPQSPATPEEGNAYYNRRDADASWMREQFLNRYPDMQFVPEQVAYDREYNPMMYQLPFTAEGEANQYNLHREEKHGGVIDDDRGQWAHPGEVTRINSNNITMKGVDYPVYGVSDTGDEKLMHPGEDYSFEGDNVTEYPIAKDGSQLTKLNQLTNFTNYNTKQPGGWLDQFASGGEIPAEEYDIKEGDTLFEIARDKGVPLNTLAAANKLQNPDLIKTGEKLVVPTKYKKELTFDQIPTKDNKKIVIDNYSPHYDYMVEGNNTYYKTKSGKTWADISDNKGARTNLLKFLDKNDYWAGYNSGERESLTPVIPSKKATLPIKPVLKPEKIVGKPTIKKPVGKKPIHEVVDEPGFFDGMVDSVTKTMKGFGKDATDLHNTVAKAAEEVSDTVRSKTNDAVNSAEDIYHTMVNGVSRKLSTYVTGSDDDVAVVVPKKDQPKTVKEYYSTKDKPDVAAVLDVPESKDGRQYKQQVMTTSNVKFGARNRGEYKDIKTDGMEVTTFHPFADKPVPFKNAKETPVTDNTSVIVLTPEGDMKAGRYGEFKGKPGYKFSTTVSNKIVDFSEKNGEMELLDGSRSGNPKYKQPKVRVLGDDGKEKDAAINVLVKDINKKDFYGSVQGGRMLLVNPDTKEQYLVSGSVAHIKDQFRKLKGDSKYLEAYSLDNGSYSRGLSYKDKKLTKNRLKSYDLENTSGGNGLYIKNYVQTKNKYKEELVDNMPNIRSTKDESFKKGHALKNEVKNIVLHHTAYDDPDDRVNERGVRDQYMTPGKNSSHVVIQKNGKRTIFASPEQVTFHAGESTLNKRDNVNDFAIGVEFQGDTMKQPLTQSQIESFIEYYAPIAKKYSLSLKDLVTHEMIAGGRKPGDITQTQYRRILANLKAKGFK